MSLKPQLSENDRILPSVSDEEVSALLRKTAGPQEKMWSAVSNPVPMGPQSIVCNLMGNLSVTRGNLNLLVVV